MRIAARVEYDGSKFCGWQSQSHAPNVQDCVEAALSKVADHHVTTVCAGRTDAQVHAYGQVVHLDTHASRTPDEWLRGSNANLPSEICIRQVKEVGSDFHARTSAIRRHYRYVILNDTVPSAILHNYCTHIYQPLDAEQMHTAAQALVGEHDFSSFRSAGCQSKSPIRRVESVRVHRRGRFVYMDICANAFLQHMVRNIMGVLVSIGTGDRPQSFTHDVLQQRDRRHGGVTLSGKGLYLVAIEYDMRHSFPYEMILPQFEVADK